MGSEFLCVVHLTGLEPAHRRYQILNLARLPIPPQVHLFGFDIIMNEFVCQDNITVSKRISEKEIRFD